MVAPARKSKPKLSPAGQMALSAMRRGVAAVRRQSRRDGIPMAIWKNGKVTLVRP